MLVGRVLLPPEAERDTGDLCEPDRNAEGSRFDVVLTRSPARRASCQKQGNPGRKRLEEALVGRG